MRRLATTIVASCAMGTLSANIARAESSEWNLHLDPALAIPLVGMLDTHPDSIDGIGFFVWGAIDWQPASPWGFELIVGAGHVEYPGGDPAFQDGTFVHGGLGLRLRFADNHDGYGNEERGNFWGNGWVSVHAGAMAWNGPQLALDVGLGYELSVSKPFQLGIFSRGVFGFFGDGDGVTGEVSPDFILTIGASLSVEVSVGVIPPGRYGVADVEIRGLDALDEAALRACLGTRERGQFGLDLGASSDLSCGEPPFDAGRVRIDFFSWPWTQWPLFDTSVFERDVLRVERWLRARGFYGGRVVASTVDPPHARGDGNPPEEGDCIADETRSCEVRVSITVEAGEPVRVERISIRGEEEIDGELRVHLREVLQLRRGDRFDESLFERTERAMVRVLNDNAYPDARVEGEVKINTERNEAYLLFHVHTGSHGVLGRICVTGSEVLPARTILNATFLAPGQPFSIAAFEEAERAIFALGTIATAQVVPMPAETPPESESTEAPEPSEVADDPETDPPYCTESPEHVPEDSRVVDVEIHVRPGRLERYAIGAGIQAGDTLGFGASSGATPIINAQTLQQWDVHLALIAEWRNLFEDMLRLRIEERPRLIFPAQFPAFTSDTGLGPSLGNRIQLSVRWPAFLEARTTLVGEIRHDYGPIPLYGFFRHELDGRVGLERSFFDGRLFTSIALRGNLFVPVQDQGLRQDSTYPTTRALFFEEIATLDLRDNPREPTIGALFSVNLQQAGVTPVSSWNYFRITAEARGYVPLGLGIVLAARFGVGAMFIGDVSDDIRDTPERESIYELDELGPLSEQLQGGGAVSNRGFPPGYMGEIRQREVQRRPLPDDSQGPNRTIVVSGGRYRWEGSLELRIPLTPEFGLVLFGDVGHVSRDAFRFDIVNLALGFGFRYRTIIGPIRFDVGFRPEDPRPGACEGDIQFECRPEPRIDLGFVSIPGAIHLTIGEAF